jgi:hypothetical protein
MLAVVACIGVMLLSCATTRKTIETSEKNIGSFSDKATDNIEVEASFTSRVQYVNTNAASIDLCVGAWTNVTSTVTIQRAPDGTLAWGFRLSRKAMALLGPVVTVSMPFALVNGRPIAPPYAPHTEENTYNFHSSMNNYQFIGGGGGALQTGDLVAFYWGMRGTTDTAAFHFMICQVPPPGSG